MTNLKPEKVTFMLLGSNDKKFTEIMKKIKKEHEVIITKTDLLNIAVDVFFNKLESENKDITDYLIQYNKL